jgi:hypothetical protein
MIPIVEVGSDTGYLFEGLVPGSYAFVPEGCVVFAADGSATIDELAYVQSGWDVRNMRFNNLDTGGSRLFPVFKGVVKDLGATTGISFLDRLQAAYPSPRP